MKNKMNNIIIKDFDDYYGNNKLDIYLIKRILMILNICSMKLHSMMTK